VGYHSGAPGDTAGRLGKEQRAVMRVLLFFVFNRDFERTRLQGAPLEIVHRQAVARMDVVNTTESRRWDILREEPITRRRNV